MSVARPPHYSRSFDLTGLLGKPSVPGFPFNSIARYPPTLVSRLESAVISTEYARQQSPLSFTLSLSLPPTRRLLHTIIRKTHWPCTNSISSTTSQTRSTVSSTNLYVYRYFPCKCYWKQAEFESLLVARLNPLSFMGNIRRLSAIDRVVRILRNLPPPLDLQLVDAVKLLKRCSRRSKRLHLASTRLWTS